MHRVQKPLQRIKKKLQKIPVSHILTQWRKRLKLQLWIFVLVILGGVLFKLILGRPSMVTLQGETMGTPYRIQYLDKGGGSHQEEIDALLARLHHTLAASVPDSELSRFNEHDCGAFYFESPFFYPVFAKSKEVYRNTAGAFDPTVLPLVNAWEGSTAETARPDKVSVNTLREYVGLDYIVANVQRIKKLKEGVKLDFSGLLQGYAVDKVAELLRTHGIEHMYIALGSEAVAYGKPSKNHAWHMAIHPHVVSVVDDALQITVALVNKAVAVSSKKGNNSSNARCIIDTSTGCPAQHTLLAAVVVTKDCSTADAYATAMMVRGLEFAQGLLAQQEDIAAFLIYEDDHGVPAFYASPNLGVRQSNHIIILQPAQEAF